MVIPVTVVFHVLFEMKADGITFLSIRLQPKRREVLLRDYPFIPRPKFTRIENIPPIDYQALPK